MAKNVILHNSSRVNMNLTQTAIKTLWLALIIIVLDQLSKYAANSYLIFAQPVPVMPYLNMTLFYNEGAAFSFLADMGGWQRWFLSALAIGISGFLIYWLKTLPARWTTEVIALNLVLGGAIGNVIDRILFGKVTDFIDFYIGNWHYATFNVADMAISAGAILLIYSELIIKPRQEKNKQKTSKK